MRSENTDNEAYNAIPGANIDMGWLKLASISDHMADGVRGCLSDEESIMMFLKLMMMITVAAAAATAATATEPRVPTKQEESNDNKENEIKAINLLDINWRIFQLNLSLFAFIFTLSTRLPPHFLHGSVAALI